MLEDEGAPVPYRQIRALYTDSTFTVYQAYSPAIAEAALAAGTFVPPFSRGRATWIKPSFLWMAYRSGWAGKHGQERVLAIEITRAGLHWALEHACLSHYEPGTYADHTAWRHRMDTACVRIQWDPERDLRHEPVGHRSIQIGLTGQRRHPLRRRLDRVHLRRHRADDPDPRPGRRRPAQRSPASAAR